MEEESNSMSVWKTLGLAILILSLIFILFILMDIIFGDGSMTGNVVAGLSGETTKLECKNQEYEEIEYYTEKEPYDDIESYMEKEPYNDIEYYTETVNNKGCDKISGCECLHWGGLFGWGSCDSCNCKKSRSVTKYKEVEKSKTVTKYKDIKKSRTVTKHKEVCVKVKRWQKPNFNENWFSYSELYDKNGNEINWRP